MEAPLYVVGIEAYSRKPDVWSKDSQFRVNDLKAVMVSFGEIWKSKRQMRVIQKSGLREYLSLPRDVSLYLDNGAFSQEAPSRMYISNYLKIASSEDVDWAPIPFDFPGITMEKFLTTMELNREYSSTGLVPVIQVSPHAEKSIDHIARWTDKLAIGGVARMASQSYSRKNEQLVASTLRSVKVWFPDAKIHLFGCGGIMSMHTAILMRFQSTDSSGWRSNANNKRVYLPDELNPIQVQLPKRPEQASESIMKRLECCDCRVCSGLGTNQLFAEGKYGFCCRASHNLSLLIAEWNVGCSMSREDHIRYVKRRFGSTPRVNMVLGLTTQKVQSRLFGRKTQTCFVCGADIEEFNKAECEMEGRCCLECEFGTSTGCNICSKCFDRMDSYRPDSPTETESVDWG